MKIALLTHDPLEIPNAVTENPASLTAWHAYKAEARMLRAEKITVNFTLCDLAKTIVLDTLPKSSLAKINISGLTAAIKNFPAYKDLLSININNLKFLQNFTHEKIANSIYSYYDIYHEKNEHQLAIIFSNEKIAATVKTYLDKIDATSEIPSIYKEKIKTTLKNHKLTGIERHSSLKKIVEYINRDPENSGPLPNEIK